MEHNKKKTTNPNLRLGSLFGRARAASEIDADADAPRGWEGLGVGWVV